MKSKVTLRIALTCGNAFQCSEFVLCCSQITSCSILKAYAGLQQCFVVIHFLDSGFHLAPDDSLGMLNFKYEITFI